MSISGFGIIPNDGATNAQRVKNECAKQSYHNQAGQSSSGKE
jgi:hypothetical protein